MHLNKYPDFKNENECIEAEKWDLDFQNTEIAKERTISIGIGSFLFNAYNNPCTE